MATVITNTPSQEFMRPAFLDGQLKRMLINGQWVEAASGKTFASLNPSTGDTLAMVAERGTPRISIVPWRRRGAPLKARGARSSRMIGNRCCSSWLIWWKNISTSSVPWTPWIWGLPSVVLLVASGVC